MIFLKIGTWPKAYKKKVDVARVIAIFEDLLTFKFETFANAEFTYLSMFSLILAAEMKYSASKFTSE